MSASGRQPDRRSDADCVLALADGEVAALAELVERYQERVVNLVHQLVNDWDAALDLGQEIFLKIYRRASTFRPEGNARSWILTVAVNLARDYLRRRRRIVYLDRMDVTEQPLSGTERGASPRCATERMPGEQLEQEELRSRVRDVLRRLPDFPRTILLLRDFEGLSYEELASVLDCEIGTVKSRLHRARKQFEELFSRLETNGGEAEGSAR